MSKKKRKFFIWMNCEFQRNKTLFHTHRVYYYKKQNFESSFGYEFYARKKIDILVIYSN